ncbi:MAG: hypothetical protein ACLSA2_06830 [Candidatus Gastranaerophilaceae bacterium]
MKFDIEYVEKLAKVLADNSLTEISLEDGEQAITLKRSYGCYTGACGTSKLHNRLRLLLLQLKQLKKENR